jgi:hypothetical protein
MATFKRKPFKLKLTALLVLAVLPTVMGFGGWTRCANGESLYIVYNV